MSDKKASQKSTKLPSDIAKMSFEDALKELEDIVRTLEDGRGELDASIKSYERGAWLKIHCEQKLKSARTRVEKIVIGSGGEPSTEPADLD